MRLKGLGLSGLFEEIELRPNAGEPQSLHHRGITHHVVAMGVQRPVRDHRPRLNFAKKLRQTFSRLRRGIGKAVDFAEEMHRGADPRTGVEFFAGSDPGGFAAFQSGPPQSQLTARKIADMEFKAIHEPQHQPGAADEIIGMRPDVHDFFPIHHPTSPIIVVFDFPGNILRETIRSKCTNPATRFTIRRDVLPN